MDKEQNRPEKSFSTGGISLAVWKNKTEPSDGKPTRLFRTVTFERRYKDKEDNWQGTTQLRMRDLLPVSFLLNKAFDYLLTVEKEKTDAEPEEED